MYSEVSGLCLHVLTINYIYFIYILRQVDSERLISMPALVASALDPRHKHLPFLPPAERDAVFGKVQQLCADVERATHEMDEEPEDVPGTIGEGDGAVAGPSGVGCKESAMYMLLGNDYGTVVTAADPQLEVDMYRKESRSSLDSNPLEWWGANHTRFPRLASLAERYLCIPGTSVPSERVFSAAGLVVNRLRTRLTPEHVDMLVFLNKN